MTKMVLKHRYPRDLLSTNRIQQHLYYAEDIIKVVVQDGELVYYTIVNLEEPFEKTDNATWQLYALMTGAVDLAFDDLTNQEIDVTDNFKYLDTVTIIGFVFHIFYRKVTQ